MSDICMLSVLPQLINSMTFQVILIYLLRLMLLILLKEGEKLLSLWDTFELFFHRKVDLLTDSSIRNPYLRKNIDSTKVLIYDGKGSKIFV